MSDIVQSRVGASEIAEKRTQKPGSRCPRSIKDRVINDAAKNLSGQNGISMKQVECRPDSSRGLTSRRTSMVPRAEVDFFMIDRE